MTALTVRLLLEGRHEQDLGGGSRLTPSVEVGVRHDGGAGTDGTGLEVGGAFRTCLTRSAPATPGANDQSSRSYVVRIETVPVAVWPSSLVIVTVAVTVKGLAGGSSKAFSCAAVLTNTLSLPSKIRDN